MPIRYSKSILFSVFILALCLTPADNFSQTQFNVPFLDKIIHFSLFFILSLLLKAEIKIVKFRKLFYILLYVTVLGVFIEVMQANCIPGRNGDVLDFLSDFSGALIAFFLPLSKS